MFVNIVTFSNNLTLFQYFDATKQWFALLPKALLGNYDGYRNKRYDKNSRLG
jgi:hypothetical protein